MDPPVLSRWAAAESAVLWYLEHVSAAAASVTVWHGI